MPDEETPLVSPDIDEEDDESSTSRSTRDTLHGNRDKVVEASLSSWVRLILFFLASCISGGIVSGQNVYSRLFCEAGLFAYACRQAADDSRDVVSIQHDAGGACCSAQWLLLANVMNILSVSMTFFFLLGGLVFDALGGRWAAVLGCVINAGGFAVLAVLFLLLDSSNPLVMALTAGPIVETAVFCIAVLLVDAGSLITNVSFFGFLWHLPRQQALILALSNSCLNVSAFIPLILRSALDGSSMSLSSVLMLYVASIAGLAMPLCWWSVPGIDEYRGRAMEVLGLPIAKRTIQGIGDSMKLIHAARRILAHHAELHLRTIVVGTLAWMAPFIYMTLADPMGEEVFADSKSIDGEGTSGEKLATMFNKVNGFLGLVLGPVLGIVVDQFAHPEDGIFGLGVMIVTCLTTIAVMCPISLWGVQFTDIICAVCCQIAILLFLTRYSIIFAPPNRIGSVTGVFVCGLGLLSLVPIIGVSIGISTHGSYIRPQVIICTVGALLWAAYLWYVKKANPWPTSPILLPEDEQDISKNFGVGSIEDAAHVAGKSAREFRRLSSSSNVMDQRALIDAALSPEAPARVMEVARRRSSLMAEPIVGDIPRYPIQDTVTARGGTIRRGCAKTSLDTMIVAMNGHGGFGGNAEPLIQYIFAPIGPPDDYRRIRLTESIFSPILSCAEAYGTVLEMGAENEDGEIVTAAACSAFHPGSLEEGSVMKTGSDRYYYSLISSGAEPMFMDRNFCGGVKPIQRFAAMKQDSQWDRKRKERGPMWYIGCLGTHPLHQGKGYARRLLDVVASWAELDGVECYLECAAENVGFYEKCGYREVWKADINVVGEDSVLSVHGMARACRVKT